MKNNKITSLLTDTGLSENEASVYFSALSLGPSTVLSISRAAELKRTTVYSILETLKQKGLMKIELRGLKKYFEAENPEKIESLLERRKEDFRKNLGEFMALYNLKGGESFIKYYEGLEGIKSVYEGLLKDAEPFKDYLVLSHMEPWMALDPEYFEDFIRRRAKMNFKIRALFQNSDLSQKLKRERGLYGVEIKMLPDKTLLTTNLVIIPKRIIIHQLHPPFFAIVIENKSIIQMHREMFEIMWQSIPE